MDGKTLDSWESFKLELNVLRSEYGRFGLLYRGVEDSTWPLTTTLERAGCEGMPFAEYCHLITQRVKPSLETFTKTEWDSDDWALSNAVTQGKEFADPELLALGRFPPHELYPYMIYLRHHGFPSPLLDWTSSPFIAAFFAFRGRNNAQKRSIYVYSEMPKGFKGSAVGEAAIQRIGPYVKSHPRHFRQQSDYTICGSLEKERGWCFHAHESVFGGRGEQDFIWKYDLPSNERTTVLQMLDDYNLNAYSLFDSEESLLETLWFQEHDSNVQK